MLYMCYRANGTQNHWGGPGVNVCVWIYVQAQSWNKCKRMVRDGTTERLNTDGCASSGELTFMAQYLWTDSEEYNPWWENALTGWNIVLIGLLKTTNCPWMSFYDVIMKITPGLCDTICGECRSTLVVAYSRVTGVRVDFVCLTTS